MKKSSRASSRANLKMSVVDEDTDIYKPVPRRSFILGGDSEGPSPVSPEFARDSSDRLYPPTGSGMAGNGTPGDMTPDSFRRTLSVKNLTASALSAIYGSAYENIPPTPGFLTRRNSGNDLTGVPEGTTHHSRPLSSISSFTGPSGYRMRRRRKGQTLHTVVSALVRTVLLFVSGAAYGLVIARLHDNGRLVPVSVEIDRHQPQYLIIWGLAGVALGSLLPWVDFLWEEYVLENQAEQDLQYRNDKKRASIDAAVEVSNGGPNGLSASEEYEDEAEDGSPTWNPVIRSIGAFVGIAYAIRKLPWQSTMQASLALSLVNPALWYLIDRSRTGFWLSTFVGIVGTVFLVGLNPDFIKPHTTGGGMPPAATAPSAAPANNFGGHLDFTVLGYPAENTLPVATWIASVLFCSSVCFGNIGRKLASRRKERELEWVSS